MAAEAAPRPSTDERIRAAVWYAEQGFGVFSVWSTDRRGVCRCPKGAACDNAGKHPIPPRGFHEATTDAERIRTFLAAASEPNYGLVCPEGVFALDVDGKDLERLAELEALYGSLPETLRTQTRNGYHIFLRWPEHLPRPIGQLFGFVTRWGSGRDAGYVIGPRSVHASGFVYAPGETFAIAVLPDAWAQHVIAPKAAATDEDVLIEVGAGSYRLPDYGYTGSRYKAILAYIASRYMRGISQDEIAAGVVAVLVPRFAEPLDDAGIASRFSRAWHRSAERLGQPIEFEESELPASTSLAVLPNWPAAPDPAAYHGVLGEIVAAVEPVTEADPVGVLGSLLAAVGACMGRESAIYQGSTQTANLFVILAGDSSSGRKGTAASIAREVMDAAYPEWTSLIVAGLGSGEGLVGHLKRVEKTEHRALVLESEFGRLLTVMTREGSTLSPVIRDAWDGVPMGRFLAREGQLVTVHHVSIAAHVTPVELRQKLSSTDAANGFGNRFLWLAVRRTRLVPFPESPRGLIGSFVEPLRRAIESARVLRELHWSPSAEDRWEALYANLATRRPAGLYGALVARAEAQIARLALLYALLDRAQAIDLPHLTAAEALWEFSERSVAHLFGISTGDRHADALLEYVAEGPVEWESARKVLGLRYSADLTDAVDYLIGLGLVEVVSVVKDGGGRRRRVIRRVNETMQTMQTAALPAQTKP
jgi:hypothetical protein